MLMMAGQDETGYCCRWRRRRRTGPSGFWPMAIVCTTAVALQLFGGSTAFTILSPFSYSSLTFKNLLNSVLLSSNANLAGGGRNFKSDVLEDASLITVCMLFLQYLSINLSFFLLSFIIYQLFLIMFFFFFFFESTEADHHATVICFISVLFLFPSSKLSEFSNFYFE